jgi:hypothetical protein
MPLITQLDQVTSEWLSGVLGRNVASIEVSARQSNWAKGASIRALLHDGSVKPLWLKICLGQTFGRSEVDYYLSDYQGTPGLPLVHCYDGFYEPGTGYHLLLDDLSEDFHNRKSVQPTLEHGLGLASALARLHLPFWESRNPPSQVEWDRYSEQIRPGLKPMELALETSLAPRFDLHWCALVQRWSNQSGMSLLHGDLNPTNILTPKSKEEPVFFLDRQPFQWSLTYGLAVYDLAYAIAPWWPYELRKRNEEEILWRWFNSLGKVDYSWNQAKDDWDLSVEHCLHVPIEWCRDPADAQSMQWLWRWQVKNITGT